VLRKQRQIGRLQVLTMLSKDYLPVTTSARIGPVVTYWFADWGSSSTWTTVWVRESSNFSPYWEATRSESTIVLQSHGRIMTCNSGLESDSSCH
jgi:hypothetical protein